MGGKIVGGTFAASIKPLAQHQQVLSRASFVAVTFRRRSGGRLSERYYLWNGRRTATMTNMLSVSLLKDATVLDHGLREFWRVFWHFPGTE